MGKINSHIAFYSNSSWPHKKSVTHFRFFWPYTAVSQITVNYCDGTSLVLVEHLHVGRRALKLKCLNPYKSKGNSLHVTLWEPHTLWWKTMSTTLCLPEKEKLYCQTQNRLCISVSLFHYLAEVMPLNVQKWNTLISTTIWSIIKS